MTSIAGRPVSPGYAEGTAVLFDGHSEVEVPRYEIDHVAVNGGVARFHEALQRSCRELRQLERRVLTELGDAQSSIFSAHLSLLEDKQFTECVTGSEDRIARLWDLRAEDPSSSPVELSTSL